MNLLDFKQTTGYFTKKRPIVILLFLFSLVCMVVSVQSGSVFIHSFLTAYVPGIGWGWCYSVAVAVDIVLFYLCAQLFSDVFCGLEGQNRYLDLPTALLFSAFLGLSLFMSIKGADVRKSYHSAQIASRDSSADVVKTIAASIDTSKIVVKKGIERNERKAHEESVKKQQANNEASTLLLSALDKQQAADQQEKKSIGELLDFSKSVVIIFQLLLLLCCASSEYIKSKKETESKSAKSADNTGKSEQKQPESKSGAIGFFGKSEGHILNKAIAYEKADGSLKYYKAYELTSMISDAERKGKKKRAERLQRLKDKLINA